jgi:hypothetical protein
MLEDAEERLRIAGPAIAQLDAGNRRSMVAAAQATSLHPDPVIRASAYRVLGALDADHRPGIGLSGSDTGGAPELSWIDIPPLPFLEGDQNVPRESGQIRIAEYPLTNAQYSAFVAAGGYADRELWTESGWEWLQLFSVGGPLSVPYPFDLSNHPRVGVTWYEAMAYAHWLNHRHEAADAPWRVRLPTELELERAIRGDAGSRFAYGDNVDYTRCNGAGTGIGSTSAVGMFPDGRSPHGLYDATGNVWEWTLSTTEEEWGGDLMGDAGRVVRGGSWSVYGNYLRATFRYAFAPLTRNRVIGLRLAAEAGSSVSAAG